MSLHARVEAMFPDLHDNMDLLKEELEFMRNEVQILAADIKQKFIDFLQDLIPQEFACFDSVDSESDSDFSDSSSSFSFYEYEVLDTEILTDSEIDSDDEFSDCNSTWDDENISSLDNEERGARYQKDEDPELLNYEFSDSDWETVDFTDKF